MKRWKQAAAVVCALVFLCGSTLTREEEKGSPFPSDATAKSVVAEFLQERGLQDRDIRIGYYNTVTGEEYYYRGDEYLYPASIYKVALCMFYARQVADGTLDWEDKVGGLRLELLMQDTLVHSSNKYAGTLLTNISQHLDEYRAEIAPFYDLDPVDLPEEYVKYGENTPRQIIFNLRLLYDYPERFPRVTEYLLRAEPTEYFQHFQQPWPVAHKYGMVDGNGLIMNDCGIIYTRSPFLLVVFTCNMADAPAEMSRLCTRLGEYTEFDTDRRAPTPSPEPTPAPTLAPTAAPTLEPTAAPTPEPVTNERGKRAGIAVLSALGLCVPALGFTLFIRRKKE